MLEAARDALFLAKIPYTRLPWVYFAIATLAMAASKTERYFAHVTPRAALMAFSAGAGIGTLVLVELVFRVGEAGLYVLYIWSGLLATLVLIHFWSLLGDLFSVTQAKRLYGVISVGAIAGSIGGTALVTALAPRLPVSTFVGTSAFGFLAAAIVPALFTAGGTRRRGAAAPRAVMLHDQLRLVGRSRYVRRVVAITVALTVAFTCSDFLFKTFIAAHFPAAHLAQTFGTVYLVLNVASLVVQLVASAWLFRKLPLPYVVAILPIGLALGGMGLVVTGGLAAAFLVKGLDGSLRYSIHRTAIELLLVPLSDSARRTAKTFVEIVGQRGAQMLASAIILVAVFASFSPRSIACVLAIAATGAAITAVLLRRDYVNLFREFVASRRRTPGPYAELDISSFETLLESLESPCEDEVLTALAILDREHKSRSIPTLILYHPSERIVIAALRVFAHRGRKTALFAIAHLDLHRSARIRAEAIAARAALDPQPEVLRARLREETVPSVRAAIVVSMAVFSLLPDEVARRALAAIAASSDIESKTVVAEVIGWRGARQFEDILHTLARAREASVRRVAIVALGLIGGSSAANVLVDLLSDPSVEGVVRDALLESSDDAAPALQQALEGNHEKKDIRRQVPGLLAAVHPESAAHVLLSNLTRETDGLVRYRSILAIQWLVEHHANIQLDAALLDGVIRRTVSRAYRYLDRGVILERSAIEDPTRATPGFHLLVDLLRDKQRNAVGRLFRLLALRYPHHEFAAIYESLESGRKLDRANAIELINNTVQEPLRKALVGLVDEIDDAARVMLGAAFHVPLARGYETVLEHTLKSRSLVVRDVAAYHVGELRLTNLTPVLECLTPVTSDLERTLALLKGAPRPHAVRERRVESQNVG